MGRRGPRSFKYDGPIYPDDLAEDRLRGQRRLFRGALSIGLSDQDAVTVDDFYDLSGITDRGFYHHATAYGVFRTFAEMSLGGFYQTRGERTSARTKVFIPAPRLFAHVVRLEETVPELNKPRRRGAAVALAQRLYHKHYDADPPIDVAESILRGLKAGWYRYRYGVEFAQAQKRWERGISAHPEFGGFVSVTSGIFSALVGHKKVRVEVSRYGDATIQTPAGVHRLREGYSYVAPDLFRAILT